MSEQNQADNEGPSWALRIAIAGPLSIVAVYGIALALEWPMSAERFGQLGDSFAPLAAMFSIAAVAVALRSVELQRRELQIQREELRETREEMKAQRGQFERTAKAQEALARSQEQLARDQARANVIAVASQLIASRQTFVTLKSASAHIWSSIEDLRSRSPNMAEAFEKGIRPMIENLDALMKQEQGEARRTGEAFTAAKGALREEHGIEFVDDSSPEGR